MSIAIDASLLFIFPFSSSFLNLPRQRSSGELRIVSNVYKTCETFFHWKNSERIMYQLKNKNPDGVKQSLG
jgi:hypothetical protein